MKGKAILIVYGIGGHKEQMKRLLGLLDIKNKTANVKLVALCEKNAFLEEVDECIEIPDMRNKYHKSMVFIDAPHSFFVSIFIVFKILKKYDIDYMISSGPGLVLPAAIIFKILNKKIIFIETWSRYTTKSLTGKFMHKISDKFYVQNKSLLKLYENAIYSGRL